MQLITIVHAHIANCFKFQEYQAADEAQELLAIINSQQSEELKAIE